VFEVLFDVVVPVLVVAAIGGAVGRRLGFSVETLSTAVFHLFSPCLVFTSMANVEVSGGDVGRLFLVAFLVFVVNMIAAFAWATLRGSDARTRASNAISAAVPNQGNMGLPMASLAFGDAGLQIAVVIFVFGVFLWSTLGIAIGSAASGGTRRNALAAPFRSPAVYAAVLGALVNASGRELPIPVREPIATLGQAAIPCMLVVLGLQFRTPQRSGLLEAVATSVNRLVIGPIAAVPIVAVVGLSGVAADTSIMMCGMPTAVMTTILCTQLDARPDLAVQTVIVSTLASIGTLTVLITLLR
jgi:predicted permease